MHFNIVRNSGRNLFVFLYQFGKSGQMLRSALVDAYLRSLPPLVYQVAKITYEHRRTLINQNMHSLVCGATAHTSLWGKKLHSPGANFSSLKVNQGRHAVCPCLNCESNLIQVHGGWTFRWVKCLCTQGIIMTLK